MSVVGRVAEHDAWEVAGNEGSAASGRKRASKMRTLGAVESDSEGTVVAHLQGEPSSGTFSFKGDRTVEDII